MDQKNNEDEIKSLLIKFLLKQVKCDCSQIMEIADALLTNGKVNLHSGRFLPISNAPAHSGSSRNLYPSVNCYAIQLHGWSCCVQSYRKESRGGDSVYFHNISGSNNPMSRSVKTSNITNSNYSSIFCYSPITTICAKPLVLRLATIIKNNLVKYNLPQLFSNDIDFINICNGSAMIYNCNNGKLYNVLKAGLNAQEMVLLYDIIGKRVPVNYYKLITTDGSISVSVNIPYSTTTEKEYHWVFPLIAPSVKINDLAFKLSKYDKLYEQAKKLLNNNKKLRLKIEQQKKENEALQLKLQQQNNEGQKSDDDDVTEQDIFKFNDK